MQQQRLSIAKNKQLNKGHLGMYQDESDFTNLLAQETSHSSCKLESNFEPPVWLKVHLNQQQGILHHIPTSVQDSQNLRWCPQDKI